MAIVEVTKITGGLVIKPTSDDLKGHQVQEARNVDFTIEPGAVSVRRGIDQYTVAPTVEDIRSLFWQDVLEVSSLMSKSNRTLYNGGIPIAFNLATQRMSFTQFANWLIMADGTNVLKYKDTGSELRWHGAYCWGFEENHITTAMGQMLIPFLYKSGGYRCTYSWELESDYIAKGAAFYTSAGLRFKDVTGNDVDVAT